MFIKKIDFLCYNNVININNNEFCSNCRRYKT